MFGSTDVFEVVTSRFKTSKYCQDFNPRSIWCFHGEVHVTRDNEGCYRSLDLCSAQNQCMLGSITYVAQTKSCTKNSLCGFLSLVIPPYVKDKVSNRSAVLLGAASNTTLQINEKVVPPPIRKASLYIEECPHLFWRNICRRKKRSNIGDIPPSPLKMLVKNALKHLLFIK